MNSDPFQEMLRLMGRAVEQGKTCPVRTGVILSLSPLVIQTGDLLLDSNDLLIDPNLLARNSDISATAVSGTADLSLEGANGTAVSNDSFTLTAHVPCELSVGDSVVMITPDGETFIVLCRVVKL